MATSKKPAAKKAAAKKTAAPRTRKKKGIKKTYIALVVDRSGSMASIEQSAFNAINEQLMQIKANAHLTGETYVSYIQFDDTPEIVFHHKDANTLEKITPAQFSPRGSTAIRDAMGRTIEKLQEGVVETDDTAYLVILISDGEENASRVVSPEQISALTKTLQDSGRWTFTYMMSNLTIDQMSRFTSTMNAAMGNVATFTADSMGMMTGSLAMRTSLDSYSNSRGAGNLSVSNFYSNTVTGVSTEADPPASTTP